MNALVIGSGMSGATAARLLADAGHLVEVLETRDHLGGNCHDERLPNGVPLHRYGPHLFHTNDESVWSFLSRFTEWTDYRHRVVADTRLGRISIPYNAGTEAQIGRRLSDEEIRDLIFVDYSAKQWGVPWEQMPPAITGRVPTRRNNSDDGYFTDRFQGQPKDGYAALFTKMLRGISVERGVEKDAWRERSAGADIVVYTGKVDEYFDCRFGELPYRSLKFEHEITTKRLPHAVINQCNALPWTRIYDHRYFSGEVEEGTSVSKVRSHQIDAIPVGQQPGLMETVLTKEYPIAHDDTNDPYYPMPFGEGMALYQRYKALAEMESRTVFIGRLATYSYLDMWMAVAQAMVKLRALI